jgi:hypothetical protein
MFDTRCWILDAGSAGVVVMAGVEGKGKTFNIQLLVVPMLVVMTEVILTFKQEQQLFQRRSLQ